MKIKDFVRSVYHNPVTLAGYSELILGAAIFFGFKNSTPADFASYILGSSGVLSLMLTSGGYQTLDYYRRFQKVISQERVENLEHAVMPCPRAAIRMLIDDYRDDAQMKRKLEKLLVSLKF